MAGLLDRLTNGETILSYGDGQTPPINPLTTKQSKMHADGSTPGYSLSGFDYSAVNTAYNSYNDGYSNTLPPPSELDINGVPPTFPLQDPSVTPINDTFALGEYRNNLPPGSFI